MPDSSITLNASQRQRLLVTCKHVDRLLGDLQALLNPSETGSVFPEHVNDLTSVEQKTIEDYIARHNEDPIPFIWTKTAKQIITKVRRGRVALETVRQSRAI